MRRGLLIAGGVAAGVGLGAAVAVAVRRRARSTRAPTTDEEEDADGCATPLEPRGVVKGVTFRSFTPADARPRPLVLMHGRGGSEDLMFDALADVALPVVQIYPRAPLAMGKHWAWARARSTDDAWPNEQAHAVERMRPFIEWIGRCFGKPVVAGHSQGAHMAFGMAAAYPELISAAVGASGALTPALWGELNVPVIAVHGAEDTVVPVDGARRMRDGLGATLVEVEGHGHGFSGPLRGAFVRALRETSGA